MNCHNLSLLLEQEQGLSSWLEKALGADYTQLLCEPLSGDASFRRYYRFRQGSSTFMLAIAPPATEKNREFVAVAQLLHEAGVLVPQVLDVNYECGFILQQDLGDQILQPLLVGEGIDYWYDLAVKQLQAFTAIAPNALKNLPTYDATLLQTEMSLFTEWFIPQLLGLTLDRTETLQLNDLFACLIKSATAQPQVFVHRDYHCRNLMAVNGELAAIDFQDAVTGPITYDAVSLLKDCYLTWPDDWVEKKLNSLYHKLDGDGQLQGISWPNFQQFFHFMGLQRHIKVLGIFARLSLRDGKHGYLNDLPTVVRYVSNAAGLYDETADFKHWFDQRIVPECKCQSWWTDANEVSEVNECGQ